MYPFLLERPRDLTTALEFGAQAGRTDARAEYIAGGTDMVQLLQEEVRRPEVLVSLAGVLEDSIQVEPQGLRLGAAASWRSFQSSLKRCSIRPVPRCAIRQRWVGICCSERAARIFVT